MPVNNCYIILEESHSLESVIKHSSELFNFTGLIWLKSHWMRWVHKSTCRDTCDFTMYVVKFFLIQTFFCSFPLVFNINSTQILEMHSLRINLFIGIFMCLFWIHHLGLFLASTAKLAESWLSFQEQWVALWAGIRASAHLLVCHRETRTACASTNVLAPSWLCAWCLWVPRAPGFRCLSQNLVQLTYCWPIVFGFGFYLGFLAVLRSYKSSQQQRCSVGYSKLGGCTEHSAFCEDVTFLTHVVIRLGL